MARPLKISQIQKLLSQQPENKGDPEKDYSQFVIENERLKRAVDHYNNRVKRLKIIVFFMLVSLGVLCGLLISG